MHKYKEFIRKRHDADHIIEIALDGIENEDLRDPKACFKYIKDIMTDSGKYYLFLDEVQFMPRFEEVLNISSDIVTEFRGRGDVTCV